MDRHRGTWKEKRETNRHKDKDRGRDRRTWIGTEGHREESRDNIRHKERGRWTGKWTGTGTEGHTNSD